MRGSFKGRETITFTELKRQSVINSIPGKKLFEMGGHRHRWVGIGFVDEGDADGTEILVTEDDGTVPPDKFSSKVRLPSSQEASRSTQATKHNPRWQYDCNHCKFSWCCGPTCHCGLREQGFADPPRERQDQVDVALVKLGYAPQFRGKGAQRR